MKEATTLDFGKLRSGQTYEDQYGGYLDYFREVAALDGDVVVVAPPWSWVPLLLWLGCKVSNPRVVWPECRMVSFLGQWMLTYCLGVLAREHVESLCTLRVETTDALWKIDNEWPVNAARRREYAVPRHAMFPVTTSNAFFRQEVKEYEALLRTYKPEKRKVVLVPCAADKPYPSPLHKAVLARIPDDWYLCIVTGTLGVVPQGLWRKMPDYDSAMPNEWRAMEAVRDYFERNWHERVVSYLDFYAEAVDAGLRLTKNATHMVASYVIPWQRGFTPYADLLAKENLERLAEEVRS